MTIDRRVKVRYPLELAVRYECLDRQKGSGEGRTVNVSSGGLLMLAQNDLQEGARMKLTIEWPSLLNGTTPLQLVTIGRVVRRKGAALAVALEHYQFKTMARRKSDELSSEVVGVEKPIRESSLQPAHYAAAEKLSRYRKLPATRTEEHHARVVVIG